MLRRAKCFQRKCRWFSGVKQDGVDEATERYVCSAFPDGIPGEIAFGSNLHSEVMPGQTGRHVYEREEE